MLNITSSPLHCPINIEYTAGNAGVTVTPTLACASSFRSKEARTCTIHEPWYFQAIGPSVYKFSNRLLILWNKVENRKTKKFKKKKKTEKKINLHTKKKKQVILLKKKYHQQLSYFFSCFKSFYRKSTKMSIYLLKARSRRNLDSENKISNFWMNHMI